MFGDISVYKVYKITNIKNNKIYVGYTSKTINERFHKHCLNAMSGIDSYLYRAIRKHGPSNFIILLLSETNNKIDALENEIFFIKLLNCNDPEIGYNITKGGTGGWVIGQKTKKEYDNWCKGVSIRTTGINNPNHSGLTDEYLIEHGVKYFTELGYISGPRVWFLYAKMNNLPQSFSKNRFNGDYYIFAKLVQNITNLPICKNKKSDSHKEKIRNNVMGKIWVTNGILDKQIKVEKLQELLKSGFRKGRTNA